MVKYALKRIFSAFAVMIIVSLLTFLALDLIPGNAAIVALGVEGDAAALERLEMELGLDRPLYVRLLDYYRSLITLDFGTSSYFGQSVLLLISQRLGITFSLAFFSIAISFAFSLFIGSASSLKRGTWVEGSARTIVQLFSSIPSFWLSLLLLIFFSSVLGVRGIGEYVSPFQSFRGYMTATFLPVIVLAVGEIGPMLRLVRASMNNALSEDWYKSAVIKGLSRKRAVIFYAMRYALTGPITLATTQLAKLLGGTAIVESVFSLPGLGRLFLTAVEMRDLSLVQGIVVFVSFFVVIMNLLGDLVVHAVNPSIRSTEEGER